MADWLGKGLVTPTRMLQKLGAQPDGRQDAIDGVVIHTRAGVLWCKPYDNWLACRFEDVALAGTFRSGAWLRIRTHCQSPTGPRTTRHGGDAPGAGLQATGHGVASQEEERCRWQNSGVRWPDVMPLSNTLVDNDLQREITLVAGQLQAWCEQRDAANCRLISVESVVMV